MIDQFRHGVSRSQVALRASAFAGGVAALVALTNASETSLGFLAALLVGAAGATAVHPDSHAGLTFAGLFLWVWVAKVDDDVTIWSLVAALGLLLIHAAAAAASLTPPRSMMTRAVAGRWALRLAIVAGATVATWLGALVFADADIEGNIVLSAWAMAVVVVGIRVLSTRSTPTLTSDDGK